MSWERGRADIEHLIADGELEPLTPSNEVAERLLADAEAHIALASKGIEDDPAGAQQLSYDAAPKASAALLAVQGLRATTRGRPHRRDRRRQGAVQRRPALPDTPKSGPHLRL